MKIKYFRIMMIAICALNLTAWGSPASPPAECQIDQARITVQTDFSFPVTGTAQIKVFNNSCARALDVTVIRPPRGLASSHCTAEPYSTCDLSLILNNAISGSTVINIKGMNTNSINSNVTFFDRQGTAPAVYYSPASS